MEFLTTAIIILLVIVFTSVREVKEYQRGIKFNTGRFYKIVDPGWRVVWPIFQKMTIVDIRTKTVDVPEQEVITKDNVSVKINAVLYYNIFDAAKSVIAIENVYYAVGNIAQTTMRNVIGTASLDELLQDREKISKEICLIVDKLTDHWGVKVENVELKDISLPVEMQRVLAKAAEAEREKAAVITKAAGEVEAAKNLAIAARTLSEAKGALHLRTLSTLNDISSDQSNTIIFTLPLELLEIFSKSKE